MSRVLHYERIAYFFSSNNAKNAINTIRFFISSNIVVVKYLEKKPNEYNVV